MLCKTRVSAPLGFRLSDSDTDLANCGLSLELRLLDLCACTAAAACLMSDDEDKDFCSITSEILRFLRMGFVRNEVFFERLLAGSDLDLTLSFREHLPSV